METESQKRCCTICDAKKICHICGDQTLLACADCAINFGATVYVCHKSLCHDEHEIKCYNAAKQEIKKLRTVIVSIYSLIESFHLVNGAYAAIIEFIEMHVPDLIAAATKGRKNYDRRI